MCQLGWVAASLGLGPVVPYGCAQREPDKPSPPVTRPVDPAPEPPPVQTPAEPAGIPGPDPAPQAAAGDGWWFTEITDEVGLHMIHDVGVEGDFRFEEIAASGCALADFDGDGRLDIYLINGTTHHRRGGTDPAPEASMDRLFRQMADGSFVDVTLQSGLRATGYGLGCAVGDYDNDGDSDLYVTNFGPDKLWRNNGDGTFSDVSTAAGIDNDLWSVPAAFVDYDRDGLLDLYVGNYVLDPNSASCYDTAGRRDYCGPQNFLPAVDTLYHNEGDGRFRDVSAAAGITAASGPAFGIVCADFNGDGWDDVYVANDGTNNLLWINQQDGTFVETATVAGCAYNRDGAAEGGMGIALGDVDGDDRLDLFITHLQNETNTLYRGAAHESWADATDRSGLGMSSYPYTGFGTGLLDIDHDGDLDLIVANGAVKRRNHPVPGAAVDEYWLRYAEPNLLYVNDGTGKFTEMSGRAGPLCTRAEVSRGLAFGDIDGDGDLDVLMTHADGPARLFRNDTPKQGRWLIVRAVDPRLNRDAIGAVVSVRVGDRRLRRTVIAAYSYASSSQPIAHFGLGDNGHIDEITVRWPDGMAERFDGVPVDSAVELLRGTGRTIAALEPGQ